MRYKGYLIDLDGTIYVGKKRLHEAECFIKTLQQKQIPFLFVTNNATKSPEMVQAFLQNSLDIEVNISQIYTSGLAALDYLLAEKLGNKGFVIGEQILKEQFLNAGFIEEKEHPNFVLQALDTQVTYNDLKMASLAIQQGAKYIVTNIDKQYPTEKGFVPGAGAIKELLVAATRVEPVIIGKPSSIIMNHAINRLGVRKEDVIMVGDNYQTDILAGIDNGIDTLLTLTGVTQKSDIPHLPKVPTHIVNDLSEWNYL
ncbi:TIGR01457 family HAD-type hydrolase [Granulicatella sp. zg-ZJ]|uniref:TIGR01457 family HAD-type hydrolase n=1 Tax=Granulicatella sp. zg-ZJ TaxID=2678504 RepID=UPI0013D4FBCE|nr:TIGR01457 family HAD-type hydrolase [Granulicatella sp. zg-ZJ]NEW62452.1 TIGR01457 family HAD-type hydrolase [Granulicatella sp. zg-ZJ]NEW62998.1 TIGR01457 family HAD-type hydrolase [Granulicatella sp. zg-ZJ]